MKRRVMQKTLAERQKQIDAQRAKAQENAKRLAVWLKERTDVVRVIYPGLKEHPGYEIMKKQAI